MAENEFENVSKDFVKFSEDMKNPLVVGALMQRLTEERQSANLLLKQINAKLDSFDSRLHALEERLTGKKEDVMLPEVDEEIIAFVKQKGRATAQEVQGKFKYKGANAASARLNGLFKQGLLAKKQVGRKVVFVSR
jgi:hypothetical protein